MQSERIGEAGKVVGSVPPQGFVVDDGDRVRLDDVVGYRFALIAKSNPAILLSQAQLVFLSELNCRLFTLSDDASLEAPRLDDVEGFYAAYLKDKASFAFLTRPDTNLFGFATDAPKLSPLVDDLRRKLHWRAQDGLSHAA